MINNNHTDTLFFNQFVMFSRFPGKFADNVKISFAPYSIIVTSYPCFQVPDLRPGADELTAQSLPLGEF